MDKLGHIEIRTMGNMNNTWITINFFFCEVIRQMHTYTIIFSDVKLTFSCGPYPCPSILIENVDVYPHQIPVQISLVARR